MRTLKQKQATKRNMYIMQLTGMITILNKMQYDCKDDLLYERIRWAQTVIEIALLTVKTLTAHIWETEEDIEK